MRELVYYIAMTIDGYICGPADEVDFYPSSDEYTAWMIQRYGDALPTHVRRQVGVDDAPNQNFDTIVMGRRTYDPALDIGITSPYAHLRQYVVSRSLTESPDPAVQIIDDDPVAAVRALKAEDSPLDIYLAGGARIAGQLLPEIDRLIVKQYPVVAGAGLPMFASEFSPTAFDLTDVQTFAGGNAVLDYRRPSSP
ncbi:dihydrofolate reductase family protein [Phytoactinopolyspora mesophila]|uniref:Dihydrofolate reductase n=1 Tax=Phytoactinopolyspora mesophila TaxID=2650750 RepID=A0A7K3M4R8_9ACTN|nr:dihydrofolate reductase [Phytoactinopolyspora mesophila]NDL57922.1 dihydrofolate reductase [Phytoactinopolyspora mesophila]